MGPTKGNAQDIQIPSMEDLGFLTDEDEIRSEFQGRMDPETEWYEDDRYYLEQDYYR